MTGFRTTQFRYSCADRGCYHDALPSWDAFLDAFPRSICPTDIDGMVEINGQFLFLEQKGEGVPMKTGQLLAFRRLGRIPNVTVVIFRPIHDGYEVMVFPRPALWEPISIDEFKARLSRWAQRADSLQAVSS